MRLNKALRENKTLRVLGLDDAPFNKAQDQMVNLSGIICAGTRFEGMLWSEVTRDGLDATDCIIQMVQNSKFHQQLHIILIDGIAVAGFNIIDLPKLSQTLDLPCLAVMRREPDLVRIDAALQNFSNYEVRKSLIAKAGDIYSQQGFVFQCSGCTSEQAVQVLQLVTDVGKVPEALRLAHLIGSAVKTGQSSSRA